MQSYGIGNVLIGFSLLMIYLQNRKSGKTLNTVNQSVNCKKPEDPTIYEAVMETNTNIKLLGKDVDYLGEETGQLREDFKEHVVENKKDFKAVNDRIAS